MVNKIANRITNRLIKRKVIIDDVDIYIYGFELLISFLFSTFLLLFIGLLIGRLQETVTYLVVFILLRSFSGGYHALTYSYCTFVTLFVFLLVIIFASIFSLNINAFYILLFFGTLALSIFSPVKNPNKVFSKRKAAIYKVISIALFILFWTVGFLTHDTIVSISNTIFYVLCADILLLFPKNIKKGVKNDACDN